jgi:hypothetical protein
MIVCTRCGASNQPTSKFCLSCGAPLAAAAPGAGAPAPSPQGPPPHYAPPAPAAGPPAGGPPPGQWGAQPPQPHYAPPPQQPAQPHWGQGYQQPPQPAPAQAAWGPPQQPAFAPAAEAPRYQSGSPEGLNPFGATVGPPQGAYGAPPQPGYAPPPGWGPPQPEQPPLAPPQAWQPPPPAPQTAPPPAPAPAPALHSKDPAAYAATAPPPTNEEFDRQYAAGAPAAAYAAPVAAAPAPAASAPPPAAAAVDPSLRVLAGFLVSYEATELGVFWPIYQGQNVVGRKGAAPGLDVEIDHPTTSSRHAVIHAAARPGKLRVEDPGSTNGTFLGEHMIEKNKSHDLRDGDAVRFGGFNVIVKII